MNVKNLFGTLTESIFPRKTFEPLRYSGKSINVAAGGDGAIFAVPVPVGMLAIVKARVRHFDPTDITSNYYELTALADNKAGTTALAGTATVDVSIEEDAAVACVLVANNTNDTVDVSVTADAANATVWEVEVEVRYTPVVIA